MRGINLDDVNWIEFRISEIFALETGKGRGLPKGGTLKMRGIYNGKKWSGHKDDRKSAHINIYSKQFLRAYGGDHNFGEQIK